MSRFRITWDRGAYYVSIPNYNGGEVVTADEADALAAENARLVAQVEGVREALKLAEDVLSRAPFSTGLWPNGMHPQIGIDIIRAAISSTVRAPE